MHLILSPIPFFVVILTVTSATNYEEPKRAPTRLHFSPKEQYAPSPAADADLVKTVQEMSMLGDELRKEMGYETPATEPEMPQVPLHYEPPKDPQYDMPTTAPTTTFKYVLNEEAAAEYWKTHVPPTTTVAPPAEDVPAVNHYHVPSELPTSEAHMPPSQEPVNTAYPPPFEEPAQDPVTTPAYVPPAQDPVTTPAYVPPAQDPVTTPAYVPPAEDPVTTPAYVPPAEDPVTTPAYVPPAEDPVTTPAYVPPAQDPVTTPAYVPPAQDPVTTPAYVVSTEAATTLPPVPVTPEYVPPADPPVFLQYVAPSEAPTTLPPVPVTPEYVPPAEDVPIVTAPPPPSASQYAPPAQDIPAATALPPHTTLKYILNEEAAKKYWATAKFPTSTKAPEPVMNDAPAYATPVEVAPPAPDAEKDAPVYKPLEPVPPHSVPRYEFPHDEDKPASAHEEPAFEPHGY